MITVNLMPSDVEKCRRAALRRVNERLRAGAINPEEFTWHLKCHETGCFGEWAVCKYYDCDWTGEYFEGDSWNSRAWDTEVGEVRATFQSRLNKGIKMYKTDDRPDAPYILAHLQRQGTIFIQAKLIGWAWQSDVRERYWSRGQYYFLPDYFLRPMNTLPTQR